MQQHQMGSDRALLPRSCPETFEQDGLGLVAHQTRHAALGNREGSPVRYYQLALSQVVEAVQNGSLQYNHGRRNRAVQP
ncbi:hypothetical protein D3C75_1184330 [compost metagenome]